MQANFHRYVHRSFKDRQRSDQIIPKVHCPKFSKVKDEGWFMVLGDPNLAELIALKRCSYRNTKSIHPITFTAPNKTGKFYHYTQLCYLLTKKNIILNYLHFSGRYLYTVYLISDSYIGFDQQYDLQLEVISGQTKHDEIIDYDFPKLI